MHFQCSTKIRMSVRVISKIESSQLYIMQTRLVPCFLFTYWFNIPVKILYQADFFDLLINFELKQFLAVVSFI